MDKLRRNDMSFVFQSVALIPTMTAYENVEFAMRLVGMPYAERVKRAKECLVRVGLESVCTTDRESFRAVSSREWR